MKALLGEIKPGADFWERPEGKFSKIALGVLGAGAVYAFFRFNVLGFLADQAWNGFRLLWYGIGSVVTVLVVTNKKFQTIASVMFKMAMRGFVNIFVKADPISFLHGVMDYVRDRIQIVSDRIGTVEGCKKRIQAALRKNEQEMRAALERAKFAKKQGDMAQMSLDASLMEGLERDNQEYAPLLQQLEMILERMKKVHDYLMYNFRRAEQDVRREETKQEAMKGVRSAIRSALSILKGGEAGELYDMAMEASMSQYQRDLGSFEEFMRITDPLINTFAYQTGIANDKLLAAIDEWDQKIQSSPLMLPEATTGKPILLNGRKKDTVYAEIAEK